MGVALFVVGRLLAGDGAVGNAFVGADLLVVDALTDLIDAQVDATPE